MSFSIEFKAKIIAKTKEYYTKKDGTQGVRNIIRAMDFDKYPETHNLTVPEALTMEYNAITEGDHGTIRAYLSSRDYTTENGKSMNITSLIFSMFHKDGSFVLQSDPMPDTPEEKPTAKQQKVAATFDVLGQQNDLPF